MQPWMDRLSAQFQAGLKVVAYLSAGVPAGPATAQRPARLRHRRSHACGHGEPGLDLDEIITLEPEPGLGNGGLGRLAACYIDSLATLGVPAVGYGIRYEYGIFRQTFVDGKQVELPDKWLLGGNPWSSHTHMSQSIGFGGHTETRIDEPWQSAHRGVPDHTITAIPYNYLVPGFHNGVVNTLRLWAAEASEEFNLEIFNRGDYVTAVAEQVHASNLSKVLYPEDSTPQGKELRAIAAVLLHRRLDPRLPGADAAQGIRLEAPAGTSCLPTQRHPPGDRHPRTHAHPRR